MSTAEQEKIRDLEIRIARMEMEGRKCSCAAREGASVAVDPQTRCHAPAFWRGGVVCGRCPPCLARRRPAAEEPISAREAARRRRPLDGADAQALEGALAATERERDSARLAAKAAMGDLLSLAIACDQDDDEYPRKAIERRLGELSAVIDGVRAWLQRTADTGTISEHDYQELDSVLNDAPSPPIRLEVPRG